MRDIIIGGIVSSVVAALIISGMKAISRAIKRMFRELEEEISQLKLKIDYMEIKHEALVLALHNYFHNGFYCSYKKEVERLSNDYKFINKDKGKNLDNGNQI
ncbi:MAG: hypothetical protein ACM3MI_10965 [Clostridiales bacterium]